MSFQPMVTCMVGHMHAYHLPTPLYMMIVSAEVRLQLIPSPPALVLRRNRFSVTKHVSVVKHTIIVHQNTVLINKEKHETIEPMIPNHGIFPYSP